MLLGKAIKLVNIVRVNIRIENKIFNYPNIERISSGNSAQAANMTSAGVKITTDETARYCVSSAFLSAAYSFEIFGPTIRFREESTKPRSSDVRDAAKYMPAAAGFRRSATITTSSVLNEIRDINNNQIGMLVLHQDFWS